MKLGKLLILLESKFHTKPQLKLELLQDNMSKVQYLSNKHYLYKLPLFQIFVKEYCCNQL